MDSLIIPGAQRSSECLNSSNEETLYGSLPGSGQLEQATVQRKSPVSSALRSLFGLQSSSSRNSVHVVNNNSSKGKEKVATIVRHGSLRSDPRSYIEAQERPIERKISLQDKSPSSSQTTRHLGSDLFQRASKKLSASSSSLTSKFKFISSASTHNSGSPTTTTTTPTTTLAASKLPSNKYTFRPPDGNDDPRYQTSYRSANQRPSDHPPNGTLQVSTNLCPIQIYV